MMKIVSGILLSVLLLVTAALGAEPSVVTLKERAVVAGEQVELKDIAAIDGPGAGSLASAVILKSPSGPIGVRLSADYILKKITAQYQGQVVLKGAREVHIARKYVKIPTARLEQLYKDTIVAKSPWRDSGRIVIEDITIPPSVEVLEKDKDAARAKISPHEDFLGRTTLTLVFGDGATAEQVNISARVKVIATVPVARTTINRGSIITEADLEMKSLDISRYSSVVMDAKECLGKRVKTGLRQGRPVLKTNIEDPPLVNRGDIVFLEAKANSLVVRDRAVALKDGRISEQIPVRNISSGKQVVGTIIAASRIEVRF